MNLDPMRASGGDARQKLHRMLWEPTLRNAVRAPLYAERWRHFDFDALIAAGPERLADLPSVSKDDLQNSGNDSRTPTTSPCHHVLTGGSTGVPMRIIRSDEEIRFLHDFLQPDKPVGLTKRGFVFTAPYHGTQVPLRTNTHTHGVNIYDRYSFDYALDVLTTEHSDPQIENRCSFITGQERVLNAFALFLNDRKIDPAVFRLDFACSQGFHITPTVRNRIETALNCTLVDRYSMSEVFGGATQNILTGWYEPDPQVIFEIIQPASGLPLEAGIGELVVTALYPFQQSQPMVRYRTGDLAEAPPEARVATGLKYFRPLGRRKYSIIDPESGEVILPASALHDALFDFPLAKREPWYLDAPTSVRDPRRAGLPPFHLSASGDGRNWELSVAPASGHDRASVEANLYDELIEQPRSRLTEAVGQGRINFAVRGTLEVPS